MVLRCARHRACHAGEDLVASFSRDGTLMGTRALKKEFPLLLWGLPELLRFFLVTERMQPLGPLYRHCTVGGGGDGAGAMAR